MRKELIFATIIFFLTVFTLYSIVGKLFNTWDLNEVTFFIAGAMVLFVTILWGYALYALIFAPKKRMEDKLSLLLREIIHELNIPLATIKANSEMLKRKLDDEKSLKRLERIDGAAVRLKRLYDELNYGINKEMAPVEKESFDLKVLVNERVDNFKEQNRNGFVVNVDSTLVKADKIGFEQMMDNIISNAMKYSSAGSTIELSLQDDILSVKDYGIGMSEIDLIRVHERYYQSDDRKKGDGIGLSLVTEYCKDEDIELKINSKEGECTQVSLDISKIKET